MNQDLQNIHSLIFTIRGQKVILDSDLAKLYGVLTERLSEQCKRNIERFPEDFRFQLTKQEFDSLIPQNAGSSSYGGTRKLPYVFTEHGAIMAANVLKSKQAVTTSVNVVRAFVGLRRMVLDVDKLARKIEEMEEKYDAQFAEVFRTLRALILAPENKKHKIGFV